MGFEIITFEDINPNRKNILDSCADYIKDQIDQISDERKKKLNLCHIEFEKKQLI